MPLWLAVMVLLLVIAGIVPACKCLREKRTLRIVCVVICALIALACAGYICLTAVFLDAARNQPPAP